MKLKLNQLRKLIREEIESLGYNKTMEPNNTNTIVMGGAGQTFHTTNTAYINDELVKSYPDTVEGIQQFCNWLSNNDAILYVIDPEWDEDETMPKQKWIDMTLSGLE